MSLFTRLFAPPTPVVAVEIAARHVSALRIGAGRPAVIEAHAIEPLAEQVVVPALAASNVQDPAAATEAVRRALTAVGGARHLALVLPDSVAKVSIVRFEQVPGKATELEALLRWNVRKSLPFKADEAQLTWTPGVTAADGSRELVVAAARRDLIAEYEAVCQAAGAHAGVVDLSTFNLINLQLSAADSGGDWLLVHVSSDYVTLAIVRDGELIFYRHRGADSDENLTDLVHQTAMYYEDRLSGRGFGRVLVAGAATGPEGPAGAEALRSTLEQRLGTRVTRLDPRAAATLADRAGATPEVLDVLAPLVGVLVREPAA